MSRMAVRPSGDMDVSESANDDSRTVVTCARAHATQTGYETHARTRLVRSSGVNAESRKGGLLPSEEGTP